MNADLILRGLGGGDGGSLGQTAAGICSSMRGNWGLVLAVAAGVDYPGP